MASKGKLTLLIDLSDKLSSKLGKLEGRVSKFQSKMQGKLNGLSNKLGKKLGVSAQNLQRAFKGIAIAGVSALSLIAYKGVSAAEQFNSAFLNIRQLNLDKSKTELDSYRDKIREAAFATGTNLEESTKAIYDLQSATGLYGDKAIAVFKKVGQYSVATGADLSDAMNATTKAMKAFGLGVNDINKLLVSNAKTVQTGITTFDELAKVQTEYAGAASAAGQGIDAANKVFAMFTSVAKNSDVGATLAKTFFQGLGQQADKIEETLGVKVFDEKGSMRQADSILKDISRQFKGMTDKEITGAINAIGGPEGLRGALSKVKTGAEDMISTFNTFDSSTFNLHDALENVKGDLGKMKKLFFNRLNTLMTKIGDVFLPIVLKFFNALNPALDWLGRNLDWVLPVFGTFIGLLTAATIAVWALNSALFANPIVWIIAIVGALIALIVVAIKKFHDWGAAVLYMTGPIGRLILLIKKLHDHWHSIQKAFTDGGIIAALKRIGTVLLDVFLEPLQQALGWVGRLTGWNWAKDASKFVETTRRALDLVTPEEANQQLNASMGNAFESTNQLLAKVKPKKEEDKKNKDLYDLIHKGTPKGNDQGDVTSKTVNQITEKGQKVRNIRITIDALHKGDVNVNSGSGKPMSKQEFEGWFEEMMMRITRKAELS